MTSAWITSTGSGAGEAPGAFIDAVSSVIDSTISDSDWRRASQICLRVHVPVVARLRRLLQDGVGLGEAVHADGGLHRAGGADAGNLGRAQATAAGRGLGQLRDAEPGRQADDAAVSCPGVSGLSASRSSARSSASTTGPMSPPRAADGSIDSAAASASAVRTAPQTLEHAARRGFRADDDQTGR